MRSRLIVGCLFVSLLATRASAQIVYVDPGATGANDGSSWPNAYTSLATALTAAGNGPAEVRVAHGTFTGGLQLRGTVQLVGAYAGTSGPDPDARDLANPTILQGPVYGHVLDASAATGARLDG